MPDWATFAAFAGLVTSALLLLSHASRGVVSDGDHDDRRPPSNAPGAAHRSAELRADVRTNPRDTGPNGEYDRRSDAAYPSPEPSVEGGSEADTEADTCATEGAETPSEEFVAADPRRNRPHPSDADATADASPSTALLLVNVAVSQGLFALLLLGGAWFWNVPARAFGAGVETLTPWHALVGVGFGVVLYAANELGSAVGERFGLGDGEELREALAPETPFGWAVLLLGVLPIIAGFEELLFRGALVGVISAGFDVSPWAMAVVSSVGFALGHGAQGRIGVVVTGVLGFVLAAGFVLTGSLLVVFVAHYLVNALEFVVHEGFAERTT
ncbi:CPBP family intramembrane glutamic endopeptidase [Halopelagius longus]|uniref:CPBP family intramembrane metalloprotease n=1 Tax=Halopelagius longus TaxID=1236180 RepID=A0A1H1D8S8_9EURY|nr:CPBP family intramembrane glutamic endopeptidase [Halopelagius longus]RDI71200.1 CPBP family intramembrane metalloprotease [Halopelagius longus]SDQ72246.1 Membrane protease YdiL, CAAX protease family [Halopelagius longus]